MTHLLFNLINSPSELLDDEEYIRHAIKDAAKTARATILNLAAHKFEPQGVTSVAMLAESHISIHTWPELGQAVCDVFTCGDHTMPALAMTRLKELLKGQIDDEMVVDRSLHKISVGVLS